MYEGYQCFDDAYAADSWMLAQTGVGEIHGTRASCVFVHLRRHWKKAHNGYTWSRLGKSNGKLEVRERDNPHALCCPRRENDANPLDALRCHVASDDTLGVLPETRCGMCALERLWVLADGGAPSPASADCAFLPALKGKYKKFSWQRGAEPMPTLANGSLDLERIAEECFERHSVCPRTLNLMYDKWALRMNERRRMVASDAVLLNVSLWRPHGLRHGAVFNMKRRNVKADVGAPFLLMSKQIWHTTYGLESMEAVGQSIVPGLVGNAKA